MAIARQLKAQRTSDGGCFLLYFDADVWSVFIHFSLEYFANFYLYLYIRKDNGGHSQIWSTEFGVGLIAI